MIKKEKQHAIVTLLITGLTFGILCLAAWFHTPNQISVSERRRLAQLPALTKDSVGKGPVFTVTLGEIMQTDSFTVQIYFVAIFVIDFCSVCSTCY